MSSGDNTKISWWRTEIGEAEIALVVKSIREEHISQGTVTVEFESRIAALLGVKHVVACTSGSTSLLMALLAAGVGPGDEVIVPNRTWVATAHAVLMSGARPVLADDDPVDKSVFVEDVLRKITKKTRALLPVHLGGRSVDLDALQEIARQRGLLIIEDAAQAFLSRNSHGYLGAQSIAGCFSLSLAKLISTGQGGFVITNDSSLHGKLTCMRNHGVEDPVHVSYSRMGFNFRFNDVLASIGIAQLETVPARLRRVREIYEAYQRGLAGLRGIEFVPVNLDAGEVPIYAEVLVENRPAMESFLSMQGVQIRPYYPSLNLAPHIADASSFPHSCRYGTNGAFLPCGPTQPLENVERVIGMLKNFFSK